MTESMRKIKRFKISSRQKEITRKILRLGLDLSSAQFANETELAAFVPQMTRELDPGTVYEYNEDMLWDLGTQTVAAQGMFSACAVTLGRAATAYTDALAVPRQLIAQTILFEFLRTAVLFVVDLVKEEAEKEECETLEPQFVYIPKLGLAPEPKLFKEAARTDEATARQILPKLLERIQSNKIDVSCQNGTIEPQATAVFIIPWQKKKRRGKK